MKSGAKGVFLTDKAIYRSSEYGEGAAHIDYTSIGLVDMSTSEPSPVLSINEEPFCVGLDQLQTKLIADILVAIQRSLSSDCHGMQIIARMETIEALKDKNLINNSEYEELRTLLIEQLKN